MYDLAAACWYECHICLTIGYAKFENFQIYNIVYRLILLYMVDTIRYIKKKRYVSDNFWQFPYLIAINWAKRYFQGLEGVVNGDMSSGWILTIKVTSSWGCYNSAKYDWICNCKLYIWLVVLTTLKNISQLGRIIPYMENKKCLKPPPSCKEYILRLSK